MIDKSTIRILVIDDEPFMLKLLTQMLLRQGFRQVTSYGSATLALQSFDSEAGGAPDLILCDLNMPEMDGIEFVRELVELCYTGGLILVSGEEERVLQTAEKLVRAHNIPILGHLRKPIKLEGLAALLDPWTPSVSKKAGAAKQAFAPEEVRAAIDNGELVNYYQPKVDVATGGVVGVECLVRWRHPAQGQGIVFPDQFIGVAEEHGMIHDLTRFVLLQALAQAKAWREAGLDLHVSVNVSMDNLASLGFLDFVVRETAAAGMPPTKLVLEVTESRLMKDVRAPLEILTRLRLKRFSLSIDDFGTGHSSLAQLRDVPFDELKIDRSFVHGTGKNQTIRAIFDASLGIARQLGMNTVAEGVEDLDDWRFLRGTGCSLAQGYFIAKAMPPAELPGWLDAWRLRVVRESLAGQRS